jgi:hypothetical protein
MDETREMVAEMRAQKERVVYPTMDEMTDERADFAWKLYCALLKKGFSNDQALFLTGHLG